MIVKDVRTTNIPRIPLFTSSQPVDKSSPSNFAWAPDCVLCHGNWSTNCDSSSHEKCFSYASMLSKSFSHCSRTVPLLSPCKSLGNRVAAFNQSVPGQQPCYKQYHSPLLKTTSPYLDEVVLLARPLVLWISAQNNQLSEAEQWIWTQIMWVLTCRPANTLL